MFKEKKFGPREIHVARRTSGATNFLKSKSVPAFTCNQLQINHWVFESNSCFGKGQLQQTPNCICQEVFGDLGVDQSISNLSLPNSPNTTNCKVLHHKQWHKWIESYSKLRPTRATKHENHPQTTWCQCWEKDCHTRHRKPLMCRERCARQLGSYEPQINIMGAGLFGLLPCVPRRAVDKVVHWIGCNGANRAIAIEIQ